MQKQSNINLIIPNNMSKCYLWKSHKIVLNAESRHASRAEILFSNMSI